jgi:hypothetical protein
LRFWIEMVCNNGRALSAHRGFGSVQGQGPMLGEGKTAQTSRGMCPEQQWNWRHKKKFLGSTEKGSKEKDGNRRQIPSSVPGTAPRTWLSHRLKARHRPISKDVGVPLSPPPAAGPRQLPPAFPEPWKHQVQARNPTCRSRSSRPLWRCSS